MVYVRDSKKTRGHTFTFTLNIYLTIMTLETNNCVDNNNGSLCGINL